MIGKLIVGARRACDRMRRIASDNHPIYVRRLRGAWSRSTRLSRLLRAGGEAYPGVIYEKLKFAYEILDKMVLPYHLSAPVHSAKSAYSA